MKKTLLCLVMALCMLLSCAALAEGETVTVEVRDSDGVTVLNEIEIAKGEKITDLGVTKEGYVLQGVYVTPALLRPFDFETAINEDTVLFVAWQSAVVDERPWMLAGSFKDYPENAWGKIWPQDEWLLKPVEDQFNTYEITLNLHEGDEFKIAVIGEGYAWSATDSLDSRNVVKSEYITGGEDAFNIGLVVYIHLRAAVVVLGADGDLQRLFGKIDAMIHVKVIGLGIHGKEPLNGQRLERFGLFQIGVGLLGKPGKALLVDHGGVAAEVHKDPALLHGDLVVYQQIDPGGGGGFFAVEGPLIALEEDHVKRFVSKRIIQKFTLVSIRIHRDITR